MDRRLAIELELVSRGAGRFSKRSETSGLRGLAPAVISNTETCGFLFFFFFLLGESRGAAFSAGRIELEEI